MTAIVVITTAGSEDEANNVASELVSRRLAACVNVLPIRRTFYRWQGKVCEDSEFLLVIKSVESEYAAIETTIQELHSYELPEILRFAVAGGEAGFLNWLAESVSKNHAGTPTANDGPST